MRGSETRAHRLLPGRWVESRARGCRKHRGLQRHRERLIHLLADVTKERHLVAQGGDPSPPWFWRPRSLMNPQAMIWAFRECSSLFLPSALSAMWSPTYTASFVSVSYCPCCPGPQITSSSLSHHPHGSLPSWSLWPSKENRTGRQTATLPGTSSLPLALLTEGALQERWVPACYLVGVSKEVLLILMTQTSKQRG